MPVVVVPHRDCWFSMFQHEAEQLRPALGANVCAIHHIGSTAIPSIWAKPIIDILVAVLDVAAVDGRNAAMAALEYEPLGEFGIAARRYFRKHDAQGVRSHQVHVFAHNSDQVARHLNFRDFLLAHADWAQQYSNLKRLLAARHPHDIEGYMDGKDAFIKHIDRLALAWRQGQAD